MYNFNVEMRNDCKLAFAVTSVRAKQARNSFVVEQTSLRRTNNKQALKTNLTNHGQMKSDVIEMAIRFKVIAEVWEETL